MSSWKYSGNCYTHYDYDNYRGHTRVHIHDHGHGSGNDDGDTCPLPSPKMRKNKVDNIRNNKAEHTVHTQGNTHTVRWVLFPLLLW